jgi:hypothetical protein
LISATRPRSTDRSGRGGLALVPFEGWRAWRAPAVTQQLSRLIAVFWITQSGLIASAMAMPGLISRRGLQGSTALLLCLVVVWHVLAEYGEYSAAAWAVNTLLLLIALILAGMARRARPE